MPDYPFRQVDVFTAESYLGNPLAVVLDADDVPADVMQRVATWTNLSETTFVGRPTTPDADYRVRIFTGTQELPFAGHPTLGSAYAWLDAGGQPRRPDVIVQECAAGAIAVRRDGKRLAFAAPPLTRYEPVDEAMLTRIAVGLGVARPDVLGGSWLVNGPHWIGVRLASADQVLAVRPDASALAGLDLGLVGPHPGGSAVDFEVRGLIIADSVVEDPVTGSLNAGLARWLIDEGHAAPHYVAAQGTALGRRGRVHVDEVDGTLWIGGGVHTSIRGTVTLPDQP